MVFGLFQGLSTKRKCTLSWCPGGSAKRGLSIPRRFENSRLLVVENGFFLDEDTSEMLRRLGARVERVDGEFWNNIDKLGTFDAVIIDVTLAADETFALSEQLDKLDIPYLFATHERSEGEQPRFQPFRLCADMKELEFIAQALFESTNFN